ncbi:MAG TPA: hypothetical protein VL294_04100 [Pseudolysinimonas sp.]|nr:hypothetical protein [Pseudolysinimonas sp.]
MRNAARGIREVFADVRPIKTGALDAPWRKGRPVLDVLFIAGILALGALIALVARAVEKL